MTKSEERDIFLKHLADIYSQNPDLRIKVDTIYDELRTFNTEDGKYQRIAKESLLSVQVQLNSKFRKTKLNTFSSSSGYFYVVENRNNKNDTNFQNSIYNSIKLYVAADAETIYYISEALFNFMLQENIVTQSKIAKEMRNDALVLRVTNQDDAEKIINYLNNNLPYKSNVKPNLFILTIGNIGIAMDGRLSYNATLAHLIADYLQTKRNTNTLSSVSSNNFSLFVKSQINIIKNNPNYFTSSYELDSIDRFKDLTMIFELISKNLDDNLIIDDIYAYKYLKIENQTFNSSNFSSEKKKLLLLIIEKLTYHYSLEEIHQRIMLYIQTGNINYFTRKDQIRQMVDENFSPSELKEIISKMGWNALLAASYETKEKYGDSQVEYAIKELLKQVDISEYSSERNYQGFTNDNDVRSYLGLIIPNKLLQEVISDKTKENNLELTPENITSIILREIEFKHQSKEGGKK